MKWEVKSQEINYAKKIRKEDKEKLDKLLRMR